MNRIKIIFSILSFLFCFFLFVQFQWVRSDEKVFNVLNRFYSSVKITPLIRRILKNEHLIQGKQFVDDFRSPILKPQWDVASGRVFVEGQELVLLAHSRIRNTGVVIPDTDYWYNFDLSFEVSWEKMQEIWVYLKRQDQNHYLRLGIMPTGLSLQEKTGQETTRVLETFPFLLEKNHAYRFRVLLRGARVAVYQDEELLGSRMIPFSPSLAAGTIGFYLWSKTGEIQEAHFDNVSVERLPEDIAILDKDTLLTSPEPSFYPWKNLEYLTLPGFTLDSKEMRVEASFNDFFLAASYFHGVPLLAMVEGFSNVDPIGLEMLLPLFSQWPYWEKIAGINIIIEDSHVLYSSEGMEKISQFVRFLKANNKMAVLTISSGTLDPALSKVLKKLSKEHPCLLFMVYPQQSQIAESKIKKGEVLEVF